MSADSAFLSGVLRLQVRHRHVGGDGVGRPGVERRPENWGQPHFAGTARRVLRTNGDCPRISPRAAYLQFLSGGCSKDPLELLRAAGVDMEQPAPIDAPPYNASASWSRSWIDWCDSEQRREPAHPGIPICGRPCPRQTWAWHPYSFIFSWLVAFRSAKEVRLRGAKGDCSGP